MLTLLLQATVSVLSVTFGIIALLIWREQHEIPELHRTTWMVVALAVLLGGVSNVMQNLGAILAFAGGPSSIAWAEYLRWAPVGNHSRSFLRVAMAVALTAVAFGRMGVRLSPRLVLFLCSGAMFLGAFAGRVEGALSASVHYSTTAVLNTLDVVTLLVALFIGVVHSSMDRLLWAALGIYAIRQALNVISFSAFAWLDIPGAWAPHPAHTQVLGVAAYLAMIGFAVHRLQLARRGVPVPALLDPPVQRKFSTLG